MKIRIDHMEVEVSEGMTLLQAAEVAGIAIPALCYREGIAHHPSCMVCMVKDLDSGKLLPSCAYPVQDGMNIQTQSPAIHEVRREALELLLSDHAGDCEAPCRRSCPAFMDIPGMNRLIAAGRFGEALAVVREEIALPLILGYICPAPCEKACHRASIDGAVAICLLKRLTADDSERLTRQPAGDCRQHAGDNQQHTGDSRQPAAGSPDSRIPAHGSRVADHGSRVADPDSRVAIIGTGPAGLAAAFYLQRLGRQAVLFDQHEEAGGLLRYQITEDKLPRKALDAEIGVIRSLGAEFRMNTLVTKEFFHDVLLMEFDAVIIASGHEEKQITEDFGLEAGEHGLKVSRTTLEARVRGLFACGNIIRKHPMAVRSVAQGKAAALSADHFLRTGMPWGIHQQFNSSFGRLLEAEFDEYLKESPPAPRHEPAKGFMGGFTEEEAMAEAARCMNCDCRKPVSCKLRIYATEYKAQQKRFAGPERKNISKSLQHEFVVYESEKCIRCGICVEITRAEGELKGLSYIGRGFDVNIDVPLGGSMKEALEKAGAKVVEACPTGALAYKISFGPSGYRGPEQDPGNADGKTRP